MEELGTAGDVATRSALRLSWPCHSSILKYYKLLFFTVTCISDSNKQLLSFFRVAFSLILKLGCVIWMALFIFHVISIEQWYTHTDCISVYVQFYKPIKPYFLVPIKQGYQILFSWWNQKKPWASPTILCIYCCKCSLAFCATLFASFLNSSGSFKQSCTDVHLHKMKNMYIYLLGMIIQMKFGKTDYEVRSLSMGDNLAP